MLLTTNRTTINFQTTAPPALLLIVPCRPTAKLWSFRLLLQASPPFPILSSIKEASILIGTVTVVSEVPGIMLSFAKQWILRLQMIYLKVSKSWGLCTFSTGRCALYTTLALERCYRWYHAPMRRWRSVRQRCGSKEMEASWHYRSLSQLTHRGL